MNQHWIKFVQDSLLGFEYPDEERQILFRGSALPVCGRYLAFGSVTAKVKRNIDFTERYYLAIGNAIHSLIQETWAMQGLLWGDWRCEECEFRQKAIRLQGAASCVRCGSPMRYQDVEISDNESGFTGRCDGVLWSEIDRGYVAVEIKTRNAEIIANRNLPYFSDFLQVSSYGTLLHRQYGLPIIGRLILWIGKPRPKPFKVWYYSGTGVSYFEEQKRKKLEADHFLSIGEPENIPGRCQSISESRGCAFAEICFSRDRVAKTKKIFGNHEHE